MTHSQYIIAREFGMERLDKGRIATVKDFKAVALSVSPSSEQMKKDNRRKLQLCGLVVVVI